MANLLTILRLLLIPVVFWLVKNGSPRAWLVLALAVLTDFLDGFIARRHKQITELGQWLDPFTDRVLIMALLTALYLKEAIIPFPLVALFLARDVIIITGAFYLRRQRKKIAVSIWGKIATFILFFAILLLSARQAKVGLLLLYIGLLFYLGSGFNYFWQGKKLLR